MTGQRVSGLLLLIFCCTAKCEIYTPPSPLTVNAFAGGNESWFKYPEATLASNYSMPSVTSRPRFGIALSGGGMRAATVGLGYLRGLHQLGVTDGARYLTSNSGGSWLNAAFSFQQKFSVSAFLGSYIPPAQLTLETVRSTAAPETFELAIANAQLLAPGVLAAIEDAANSLTQQGNQLGVGAWSETIGRAFLQPYDLNSDASTFTADNTSGPVHQALTTLDPQAVQVYRYKPYSPAGGGQARADSPVTTNRSRSAYRPYPIMMGAIMLPETLLGFYPFEFTPLYVGIAPFYNTTDPPVGGGYVDPAGLNSDAPTPPPTLPASLLQAFANTNVSGFDNGTRLTTRNTSSTPTNETPPVAAAGQARLDSAVNSSALQQLVQTELLSLSVQPSYLVPLKVVAGISSSFITNLVQPSQRIGRELTGTEVLKYWSPINFTAKTVPFADGGSADNLAITPLLRRRMTKIIMLVAASDSVTDTKDAADWGGYQYDVSGLFGAAPSTHPAYDPDGTITGVPVDLFNRKLQVFPTSAYQALYNGLRNTTAAGGPTFHVANYTVLTNNHQAIFGGWRVEVLWVVNQRQADWEAALPKETSQLLQSARGDSTGALGDIASQVAGFVNEELGTDIGGAEALGLEDFPLISTGMSNYSPELTKLLSQQANWQMLQLRTQLQQFLQGTNVTVKQAA